MKALISAAVGAVLLLPTFCQSGKPFACEVGWGCWFVLPQSTESNFLCILHQLLPKRQSLILVIRGCIMEMESCGLFIQSKPVKDLSVLCLHLKMCGTGKIFNLFN